MNFASVKQALEDIKQGRMVILVDDEDRENEGDLFMAAEKVNSEAINFMAREGRGLICLTLTPERLKALDIPMMVADNTSTYNTAFTVSIEARLGVSTGISAHDRATTILAAIDERTKPTDLARPGHIFPLRARPGGVLARQGQTEGSVDLARLSGLRPAGVICEIMNDDGSMSRMAELELFAKRHALHIVSIADLIEYRLAHESVVRRLSVEQIQHPIWGDLTLYVYGTHVDDKQHLVVVKGSLTSNVVPLVGVQSGFTHSGMLDWLGLKTPFTQALWERLAKTPAAVLVCVDKSLPQVSLHEQLQQLKNQTLAAESTNQNVRSSQVLYEVGLAAQILRDLSLTRIRWLTSQPHQRLNLDGYGFMVDEIISFAAHSTSKKLLTSEVLHG